MELSFEVQNYQDQFKFLKSRNSASPKTDYLKIDCDTDIIDLENVNFGSDETWLYAVSNTGNIEDVLNWLHEDISFTEDFGEESVQSNPIPAESAKNIDTRTFTRPKKRFTRPSIEKYNEEIYGKGCDMKKEMNHHAGCNIIDEISEPVSPTKPLNFDLTQPTNSYYFNSILASNTAMVDSFQNMSPPSLVNSMCSSTFANLMESSFIKNDPVLKEICDTDYTQTILLQDEAPVFQSFTESWSSLNSDIPENYLRKMSFNGTYKKNVSKETNKTVTCDPSQNSINNRTYGVENTLDNTKLTEPRQNQQNETRILELNNFNETNPKCPKQYDTFRKSDKRNYTLIVNSTYDKISRDVEKESTTQTLIKDSSIKSFEGTKTYANINADMLIEDIKKELSDLPITDLNRLSYCLEDENIRLDSGYTESNNDELNRSTNMKRSSLVCSTGSADSLDRMSSISNSSRESNRMFNLADVDAIIEMQERCLNQVTSTPKPGSNKFLEMNFTSPQIPTEQLSDTDGSSNDEYKSVKSSLSKISLENFAPKQAKSVGNLGGQIDTKLKTTQRSTYTLAMSKPMQVLPNSLRGSYTNLRAVQQSAISASQSNLHRPGNIRPPSTSNLKTMGPRLKGSYTSLRPISANLPVVPPFIPSVDNTIILPKATNSNVTWNIENPAMVYEVPSMPKKNVPVIGDSTLVRPKASGLPRPTGIPRPASRIPGPRHNNLRPTSARLTSHKRDVKDDHH